VTERPWWRAYPDLIATACLFLTAALIFAPPLMLGMTVTPMTVLADTFPWRAVVAREPPPNAALGDIAQVFHPWLIWIGEQVRHGIVPLWNPHAYTGAPFFGNGQTALLFPLTWLPVVMPAAIAVTIISWLKLFGIGLATYWFLRTLGLSPVPALTGAWTFMLSATVIGWLQWTLATTLIFLPALLAATERLRRAPGRRAMAVLSLIVAFDLFAGYPQGTLQGLIVATAWALTRCAGAAALEFVASYAAAVALGLALTAVQLLPFVEYVRESLVFAYRGQWTLPLYAPATSAVTFVMPYFYGTGAESWGRWQFNILTGYVGILPVAILPIAVLAAWRRPGGRFILGLAVLALAVHYGAPGLAALAELPGLSLGTNLRLMPLVAFAFAALLAFGVEWLRDLGAPHPGLRRALRIWFVLVVVLTFAAVLAHQGEPRARALSLPLTAQYAIALAALTLATVLIARVLAGRVAPGQATLVFALIQLATLLPLAATYNPSIDRRSFYPSTPAIEHLQRATADGSRVLMPGHVGLVYGLFEAHGYDGLTPRRIEEVTGPVGTGRAPHAGLLENILALNGSEPLSGARLWTSPVLDLVGIRYILLPPGTPTLRAGLTVVYDAPDGRIFRNETALPRAFLVGHGRCVDDAEARRLIAGRSVDFRTEVLLADCAGSAGSAGPPGSGASARITGQGPHAVEIRAVTDRPAYLVLTDTWYPGWTAWVDGRATRLWRANHAFRAVSLSPGEHRVEFHYEPTWLTIGLAISGLSLAGVSVMLATGRS
jgi:membrane protein YfhO